MANRIAVTSKVTDARAKNYLHTLNNVFPRSGLTAASVVQAYTIDAVLSEPELQKAAERLANPIIETFAIGNVPTPASYAHAIEIGYLPGVTDNVGATAQETIEDCLGKKFKDGEHVYSSTIIFLEGKLGAREVELMARELHNPPIERASVFSVGEKISVVVPKVKLGNVVTLADEENLDVSDAQLQKISKEGI